MGITPQQLREMEERVGKTRKLPPSVSTPTAAAAPRKVPVVLADLSAFHSKQFIYQGDPVGKPRMTARDKWKKRPCVLRYRAFADGIREAAGELPLFEPDMVIVTGHVAMPSSWSNKKKELMEGQPMRQRPDWDNIGKAVCDALFEEDCCIWLGVAIKYWCRQGSQRLDVQVLYAKSQ